MQNFDVTYKSIIRNLLRDDIDCAPNRTGVSTRYAFGLYRVFDLRDGFPLLGLRRLSWKSIIGEMLGFLRGYTNAAQFRRLGCHVWDANANENEEWRLNQFRKGDDDLGRIYGAQARDWRSGRQGSYDQLWSVYNALALKHDNRRLIVSHWNPAELAEMALPPCHMFYQFGLAGPRFKAKRDLDLALYVRSNDVGLGLPYNVAGYAWLLSIMAHITGNRPRYLHYFAFNYHIYDNHTQTLQQLLERDVTSMPTLRHSASIRTLSGLEDERNSVEDISWVENYHPHPKLYLPMAV